MIITRSPLRITLGGGGTDLPSYYRQFGGFVMTAAIDKYVFVTVTRPFAKGIYLKYSQLEKVDTVAQIRHPIIREALKLFDADAPQIEITTLADIPSGTGLGSSGSFTTALLKALHAYRRIPLQPTELAELACDLEINKLHEPVGRQDQYAAAFGGVTWFKFHPDESVESQPLTLSYDRLHQLEDNLLLFFTGFERSAGAILRDQDSRTSGSDPDMLANLHYVKELGLRSRRAIETGRFDEFGELLHEHWEHKKRRSAGMSNPKTDEWYALARRSGALGGKLVGAGGGGFMLFYTERHRQVREAMQRAGLQELRFQFDFEGTKVLFS
ncbi:MAG: galactokinase [Acidobacteria bacterium]|nr:galactokinase [Acidobacteriota bacterium]